MNGDYMFQETTLIKQENGKKIIDSDLKIKWRDLSQKFILLLSKTNIKYKIVKQNNLEKIEHCPIIYAINHYSAQDTPIACNVINERCYILAGKQNLGLLDKKYTIIEQ